MDNHVYAIIQVLGFLILLITFVWKIARDRQADFVDNDKKISRVFGRLDEVKTSFEQKVALCNKEAEDRFVNIKICKVLHDTSDQNFQRLDKKVDTLGDKIDKIYSLLSPK